MMTCLTPDEMELYIMDTDVSQGEEIFTHIDTCSRCAALYEQLIEEQIRCSGELFGEVLTDSFTHKVMNLVKQAELEPSLINEVALRKGFFQRGFRGIRNIKIGAALLIVLVSTVILSLPTLADTLRSLFSHNTFVDMGLLRAREFGLVQHPDIMVEDKGYTVRINEVVADSSRVVLALQLFDQDGKHQRNNLTFHRASKNSIKIKDDQGRIVGDMYDYGGTEDFYYMVCSFPEPVQTDRITIEGQIAQLGNELRHIPPLQGNWNFNFPIDLQEANKKTTVTPIEQIYTSPDGMTVTLKKIIRTATGVRLEIDTELSDEALNRSSGELWKEQRLKFHFEDQQGQEIHSVNTRKAWSYDRLIKESQVPGDRPGVMHWNYLFQSLPEDKPYTFVFDGYSISEHDRASIQFEPSKLKEHPVSIRFDGDELMLRNFTLEPSRPGSNDLEGVLHLDGKLRNEERFNQWQLSEPDGEKYKVSMGGTSYPEASNWKDGYIVMEGARKGEFFKFHAAGLTTIPDKLQLTRTVVDRLHTNVDWSVQMNEQNGMK